MADSPKITFSRRGFIKGAGVTAATSVIETANALTRDAKDALQADRVQGPDALSVKLHINGREHSVVIEPRDTLAQTLRDNLGLTGTKVVCDRGSCSACTIWIDKTPALACMTLAIDATGREITTIEGLSHGTTMHPVQAAFVKHDAMQCGFCTPGMVMSCAALLERNPKPTLGDVKHAVSGNLCRCGTYPKVFAATLDVASEKGRSRHGTRYIDRGAGRAGYNPDQAEPAKRSDSFVFGIPQNGLEHKQRDVLLDEPPPLPPNSELMYIGKPTVRYDGPAKAMGTGKYTADIHLPGMLYARMVDATIPHGRIVSIDTSEAEKLSGRSSCACDRTFLRRRRAARSQTGNSFPLSGDPLRRSTHCRRGCYFATDCRRRRKIGEGAVRSHALRRGSLGGPSCRRSPGISRTSR